MSSSYHVPCPPAGLQAGILEEAGFPGCAQTPGKTGAALKPAKLGLQVFPGLAPDHLLLAQAGGSHPTALTLFSKLSFFKLRSPGN